MVRGLPVRHPGGLYVQPGSKPIVMGLQPPSGKVGVAQTVVITGGGFGPASVLTVDGSPLAATFIDDTHLSAFFPGPITPGVWPVTVTTGALTSNAVNFPITAT